MSRSPLRSILYVDDDPDIRELVQMALESISQIEVRTAESGEAALAEMCERRPDMVLLDVMMPGLDGPATLQRMRQIAGLGAIPVLFMTAKSMPQNLDELKQMGVAGVIGKPFDPMRLPHDVLARWELLDAPGA